jgi:hypothetical protein
MRVLPITTKALSRMLKRKLIFSIATYEKECLIAFCPPMEFGNG